MFAAVSVFKKCCNEFLETIVGSFRFSKKKKMFSIKLNFYKMLFGTDNLTTFSLQYLIYIFLQKVDQNFFL